MNSLASHLDSCKSQKSITLDSAAIQSDAIVIRMGIYKENLPRVIREQLQGERNIKGWTYSQLADAAGLKEQSVMRYLTGKREIDLPILAALSEGMGIDPMVIMKRATERIEK